MWASGQVVEWPSGHVATMPCNHATPQIRGEIVIQLVWVVTWLDSLDLSDMCLFLSAPYSQNHWSLNRKKDVCQLQLEDSCFSLDKDVTHGLDPLVTIIWLMLCDISARVRVVRIPSVPNPIRESGVLQSSPSFPKNPILALECLPEKPLVLNPSLLQLTCREASGTSDFHELRPRDVLR